MSATAGEYLTSEELAVIFKVKVPTIRRWHREGRLPRPVWVGRNWLWRRDQLDEIEKALTKKGGGR
jgi:excisionase family DNA binding protein